MESSVFTKRNQSHTNTHAVFSMYSVREAFVDFLPVSRLSCTAAAGVCKMYTDSRVCEWSGTSTDLLCRVMMCVCVCDVCLNPELIPLSQPCQ